MPRGTAPKLAITMERAILDRVRAAAADEGVSASAWLAAAAEEALQKKAQLAALDDWEEENGPITEEEIKKARRWLREEIRASRTARRSA